MSEQLRYKTAADIGRGIGAGDIDPVALLESYLEAADSPIGQRTYARLTPERAHAEARAAAERARIGERLGPLDGVPISWKDLVDTAQIPTEAGSKLLQGRTPDRDAVVLRHAAQAGLVCLGKTHMSELAFAGLGYNPITDTPPCVNDLEAVPGGSSSGAGASVAFGLAAAGIGSDTGGSVRVPSAWNDLVGLKTTSGLLSLEGVVPLCASFDTIGPLVRSVEDASLLLSAMSGAPAPSLDGADLRGSRIAVLETLALDDVEEMPGQAFDRALAALGKAGADVVRLEAPEVTHAMSLAGVLYTTEAWATWGEAISGRPELMYSRVRERFEQGQEYSGADYVRAWQKLVILRKHWAETVSGYDAVILPTSVILPPKQARIAEDEDYYVARNLIALRNTRIGNLLGLSALTLPTGVPSCGLMMMGRPMGEDHLLRIGVATEAALAAA